MPSTKTQRQSAPKPAREHEAAEPSEATRPGIHIEEPAKRSTQSEQLIRVTRPTQSPAPRKTTSSATGTADDEVSRGCEDSPKIALTFDAGWEYRPGARILDALADHHVHATFFLTGKWIERNSELTCRIAAEGHEIGNHTYSHKRLTTLSAEEIAEEAEKVEQLVLKLTGKSTKPLLRVPYGARDKRVLLVLKELGYRSIYWDVDSYDAYKANITPAEIEQRVLSKVRNGSIVLMHIGSKATAEALDPLLQKLLDAGYQPVTVGELLSS